MTEMTVSRLREVLHYDPATGVFTWRVRAGTKAAGSVAGTPHKAYVRISVDGLLFRAHRLAWLLMTNAWPGEVDHRDGDGRNNRWANLRLTDKFANLQNQHRAHRNNRSAGLLGVSKQDGRFRARILHNGQDRSLGMYDTAELAHAAYLEAKRELHQGNTL